MSSEQSALPTPLLTICLQKRCVHLLLVYWRFPATAERKSGMQTLSITPQREHTLYQFQASQLAKYIYSIYKKRKAKNVSLYFSLSLARTS